MARFVSRFAVTTVLALSAMNAARAQTAQPVLSPLNAPELEANRAAQKADGTAQAKPTPSVPLRVLNKNEFCARLQQGFAAYGAAQGFDRVQAALLASNATTELVQEFRLGRASDFLNATSLAALANAPAPAADAYVPTSSFLGQAMGIGAGVTLALSPSELRFLPYAPRGIDLVVVAQNAAAVTPERAHKVSEAATAMGIRIDIIWVGTETPAAQNEARTLAWIAAVTGGTFLDLSGTGAPCANHL